MIFTQEKAGSRTDVLRFRRSTSQCSCPPGPKGMDWFY